MGPVTPPRLKVASMNVASVNSAAPVGLADLSSTHPLTEEQRSLIRAVSAVNASGAMGQDNQLKYSVDRTARLVVVQLVNKVTGEVVNQIPNESLLRLAEEINGGETD